MAFSYSYPSTDGVTTNFSVPFPYLSRSHVHAMVDGSEVSFSWISSGVIRISPAPSGVLKIYRETPVDTNPTSYTDGSILLSSDLNLQSVFTLMVLQEHFDTLALSIHLNASALMDAQNKRIVNVADPVDPQDAATKAWVTSSTAASLAAIAGYATSAAASATAAHASEVSAAASAAIASADLINIPALARRMSLIFGA